MLDKLFESLDEKVFTAELKQSLQEKFDDAVEVKASVIAESRIEEEIDSLNEKSEKHIEFLNEKAEEYVEMKQAEMLESLDKYLERIVEEFVAEAKASLDESVKNEKADMIIEAFDSMLVATGVKVASIVEAKQESEVDNKLQESVEKYDSLVEEVIALKQENDRLLQMGVIAEMVEDLSLVEAEKFKKLANLVDFSRDEKYAEKLEQIKESIKGSATEEKLEESTKEETSSEKPVWAHLV